MNLIVCVDNRMGMQFNNRRQSRDKVLYARLLEKTEGRRLWLAPASARLFGDAENLSPAEDFLDRAGMDDFCFAEAPPLAPWSGRICRLILCRWNRDYPADRFLDLDPGQWQLLETEEFPGSSHEKITVETYGKRPQ